MKREFCARIARAKSSGLDIKYVDCHMGMACREEIPPITRKIAADNCIPIAGRQTFPEMQNFGLDWDQRTPADGRRLLEAELRKLTPGLWMYVAHLAVAYPNSVPSTQDRANAGLISAAPSPLCRPTDPEIRKLIDELGIEFVGPRDLFDYQACAAR